MSHTLTLRSRTGEVVHVHHNGDWSGDVTIARREYPDIVIPGALLIRVGKAAARESIRDLMIEALEALELDEEHGAWECSADWELEP